ncbi:hypothetical protein H4582DRAFT_2053644 [Lactarius indigo]|nr:hypothetical protein H4582DRAFT_2053644 [Lactarius indigo]
MLLERKLAPQHAAWKFLDLDDLSPGALPVLCSLHMEESPGSPGWVGNALLRSGAALDALGNVSVDAAALKARRHGAVSRLRHSRALRCTCTLCSCSHAYVACARLRALAFARHVRRSMPGASGAAQAGGVPRLQVEHWDLNPARAIALAWEGNQVAWIEPFIIAVLRITKGRTQRRVKNTGCQSDALELIVRQFLPSCIMGTKLRVPKKQGPVVLTSTD